jgi:hypothetical protein
MFMRKSQAITMTSLKNDKPHFDNILISVAMHPASQEDLTPLEWKSK